MEENKSGGDESGRDSVRHDTRDDTYHSIQHYCPYMQSSHDVHYWLYTTLASILPLSHAPMYTTLASTLPLSHTHSHTHNALSTRTRAHAHTRAKAGSTHRALLLRVDEAGLILLH